MAIGMLSVTGQRVWEEWRAGGWGVEEEAGRWGSESGRCGGRRGVEEE